jgi:O-antigen/teichoic acid export membrane protein
MTRLSRNLFFNVTGQAVNAVLAVLAVRYIFRGLGTDAFGLIYFSLTVSAAATVALELGLTSTTVREVAAHFESDPGYVNGLIRTAGTLYWSLYLLALLAVMLAAPLLVDSWLHLQSIGRDTAVEMLRLLGAGSLLLLPQGLYASLLRGRQRMGIANILMISTFALQQGGILAVVLAKGSFAAVVTWILASSILEIAAFAVASARLFSWRVLVPGWDTAAVRRNRRFTTHMMAVSATSMVHTQSDKIAASRLLPIADFGCYTFASSICARASLFSSAVIDAALPSLSSLAERGTREALGAQYRKLQDFICLGTVPILAGIVFSSPVVFRYVFSSTIADRLLLPVVLLSLGFYMNATISVPYVMCLARNRPDIPSKTNSIALFVVLPATVVLVWRFGMVGGGLSWVFFHLYSYAYLVPRACHHCLEQRPRDWYWHVVRVAALATVAYGGAWVLGDAGVSLTRAAASFVGGSLVYGLVAHALLGPELRTTVHSFVKSASPPNI